MEDFDIDKVLDDFEESEGTTPLLRQLAFLFLPSPRTRLPGILILLQIAHLWALSTVDQRHLKTRFQSIRTG